jgi:hypothetical protein
MTGDPYSYVSPTAGALTKRIFFDKFGPSRTHPDLRNGEVSEWFKEHAWKACVCRKVHRGFESRPLRHSRARKKES